MLKKLGLALACVGALVGPVWADGGERFAFAVGERLEYQIFWGPFAVGRASLEVAGIERVDGHDCYHLVAKAKTTGIAEWMFPVDSTSESWLDLDELCTRRSRQKRSEGKRRYQEESFFHYQQKQLTTTNFITGRIRTQPLTQPVQDVISSIYFVRTRPLQINVESQFLVDAGKTNCLVSIRPDQRKSLWVRPLGDVFALRVEPLPTLPIIAANKGHMWFWVSDDARHLPLLVSSDMKIGSARLVLAKVEYPKPTVAEIAKMKAQ